VAEEVFCVGKLCWACTSRDCAAATAIRGLYIRHFFARVWFWVAATTVYLGFCLWAEDGPFARDSERGRELSRLSAIPSSFILEKKMKVREREKFRCHKQP
jgi:hypothetical protein